MKHEWKKHEKEFYSVKQVPELIHIPMQQFIMISGKGNPNDVDFSQQVAALYSLAYAIKMGYKTTASELDLATRIHDFSVYPLEGIWKLEDGQKPDPDIELRKDKLQYTIMIRQPDFITGEMVNSALERVKKKKPTPMLEEISFNQMEDGACIQILHIGPFDNEPASFAKMDQFAKQNNLLRKTDEHRELYLNNARRISQNKLQTILRYSVRKPIIPD